jgi:hypothetical protein
MLKRILLSVIVAALVMLPATAQKSDQVILKNGSTIRGNIVSIQPEGNVTINDLAGNTWVFAMSEVKEILKTNATDQGAAPSTPHPATHSGQEATHERFDPGFVNMTTIGFLAGSQRSDYIAPFSMQTSFGYYSGSGLYGGFLAGLEFLNINHIPVMLDVQYALRKSDVMPVLIARGGYAVPSKTNSEYYGTDFSYSGGVTGALGMGLKIRTRDGFAWDVSMLYRYMQINYTEENEWQSFPRTYKDVYNRLEIRIGFYLDVLNR